MHLHLPRSHLPTGRKFLALFSGKELILLSILLEPSWLLPSLLLLILFVSKLASLHVILPHVPISLHLILSAKGFELVLSSSHLPSSLVHPHLPLIVIIVVAIVVLELVKTLMMILLLLIVALVVVLLPLVSHNVTILLLSLSILVILLLPSPLIIDSSSVSRFISPIIHEFSTGAL